jgi:chemotaxis protein histidine kinase CheA
MITDQDIKRLQAELLQAVARSEQAKEDAARAKEDAARAKEDAARAKEDAARAKIQAEQATEQLSISMQKLQSIVAESSKVSTETNRRLDAIGLRLGNIGQNQGDVAEEFFYNSLGDIPVLGGIQYDFKDRSWRNRVGQVQDEFDIVLINGHHVAIIEVKYKAHFNDLDKLLTKKLNNFKLLFPQYTGFEYHLALASLHIHDELKQQALQSGVMVLQRSGDIMETSLPI